VQNVAFLKRPDVDNISNLTNAKHPSAKCILKRWIPSFGP